ncbi:flagellar motor protein MotB [Maribacter algarum]|uniref:Flagellar motor protein MotB n=1 Tax=Maribacter algarum (ex Zhang et al. 2020) TaxID=2578118 RepID=A0A5S3PGK9_9FLAO|nr:OmpA family protein [Maribacter algarum]TMM53268.1 flagellar motor protein MotB [Maribacter algarum]
MNKKSRYILSALLLAFALVTAQDKKTKKAKQNFEDYSYAPAIERYEDLVEKGYSEEEIFKNLGDANYQNANYGEAANWYSKLFAIEGATLDADYMYRYAQSLKSSKEYEASDVWMQKYQATKTADVRAKKIANNPDYLKKIENNSGRYEIKNLSLNSAASDFAPAFKGEQLVFSSARDSGTVAKNIHTWNNKSFTNLYSATATGDSFGAVSKVASLNKKTHETSAVFTKDGSTVYFTRNNSENGRFSRDEDGVSRLKIYRASLKDGAWTNIVELPFNADGYSAAHPALSPDERKLYFASDMEGTIGASDIFVVDLNEDGSIGAPKNLGNSINTEARETFPFVTASNALYFASDGHPGLGGLDVYATKIEDMDNIYVVNVGKSVNSEQDDFSFIINEETKKGFFASNRDGGVGSDDIYGFTENEEIDLTCNTLVEGIVKDKETGGPLAGAKVTIFNTNNELVSETTSGVDGSFVLEGDCRDGDYKLIASMDEYDDGEKMFAVVSANDTSGVEIALEKTIKRAPVGTDLVQFLSLKPVYFDLDKADIRPDASATILKVIEYMNLFPDIKIQVESHTDTKAGTRYNERLSQRRADNTVTYLISNKMDESRVSGKGFGESKLANDCIDWTKCTPEKNEQNRRSEFIVIE